MHTIIWIYLVLFIVGAVVNVIRGLAEGAKFSRYMEEHHPQVWRQQLYNQVVKKVFLLPFGRGSIVHFIIKSTEDFGDRNIGLFRQKLRWVIYGWLLYLLVGFLGLVMLSIIFEA